jgi:hypothetical protein
VYPLWTVLYRPLSLHFKRFIAEYEKSVLAYQAIFPTWKKARSWDSVLIWAIGPQEKRRHERKTDIG